MALQCAKGGVTTHSVSGTVITGSTPIYDSSGAYYSGTSKHSFDGPVKYVTVLTGDVWYTISGNSVTFKYTSSTSGAKAKYTASVDVGYPATKIEDVASTSGVNIDYIKAASTNQYVWTRPTAFDIKADWDYFRSWSLTRTASSLSVDSTAGTVKSNSSLTTSGTNKYTITKSEGLRYGDNLKFSYELKPGAKMSMTTEVTIGRDCLELSSCGGSQETLPTYYAELNSQWNFGSPGKDTLKNSTTCDQYFLVVKKPDVKWFKEDLAVDVSAYVTGCESYYINDQLIGWSSVKTNTSAGVKVGDGDCAGTTLSGSYAKIGTIKKNEDQLVVQLLVTGSGDKRCPKYTRLRLKFTIQSSCANKHKYKTSEGQLYVYGGTATSGSSSGGGGYVGSGGGGYGGWMPS